MGGGGRAEGTTGALSCATPTPTPPRKGEGNPRLRRHDLVRVDPTAWAALLADRPDLAGVPPLPGWAASGWPLIVRRLAPGEDRARVPLGLPLPPALGKRRIGFGLPPAVLTPGPAPTLAEARAAAPPAWHPTLDALIALGARHGLVPRPFGGLLWQALTGLPYLTATSDLDLLWPLAGPLPKTFLDDLAAIAAAAPMRLDGEIVLPDGGGVQWREWHEAGDGEVLVKHRERLEMRSVPLLGSRIATRRKQAQVPSPLRGGVRGGGRAEGTAPLDPEPPQPPPSSPQGGGEAPGLSSFEALEAAGPRGEELSP
ncbi:malonate decarboxylase holo-[acyl-carrier-protein] synthase [Methylorubrum rhodinum]|uniref:malonate decarboxylase holo-[acyl-carrier-protein] synthase n=1 Tax=Methylorubrum rhodinum TaxID=29428 RepID=UPI00160A2F93